MKCAQHYDVVVIGSGIAGLSAAIEAKSHYPRVLIIEKLTTAGGNSLISDGGIAVVGSDIQRRKKIDDSVALLTQDILKAGGYQNNPKLVDTIAKHSNQAYEWTKAMGVQYQDRVDFFGGHSVKRCLTPLNKSGKDFIKPMVKYATNLGVEFLYNTKVLDITIQANRATEVHVESKRNNHCVIHINHRLIVAAGGFSSNQKMIEMYNSSLENLSSTNLPSAQGELLVLLEAKGAQLIGMENIQCGPWASPDEKGFGLGPLFADYIALPYGILINPKNAQRFVNERADRKVVSDALISMPYALAITDHTMVLDSGWDIARLIQKKVVEVADDLSIIAERYGMDSTKLKATIDTYNNHIVAKANDHFLKDLNAVKPLINPPYYTMKTVSKIHHTMGGIQINEHAQVITKDGQCFENVFAAGECTGGVHGISRLGSMAITDCLVMGRIAGKNHHKN